ncbi:metallophosphatase domain-containing protein [Mesonia aquimarina]|uniref:metallophosphatase domain-containing protein n=1 Tax=Mesonia aquimarina TaxID=1504967 RepID=UPI000EF5F0BB|nr:metallophosphatase domain-containing protein [Mesonia aquimarina]
MTIICISDTHNNHKKLEIPAGDILIHAGDLTEAGTKRELESFFKWFSEQPHQHKICIAGNHDFYLESCSLTERNKLIPKNVHYLHDKSVKIMDLNFWGSPHTPVLDRWAFGKDVLSLEKHWDKIPKETDVVITHTPPYDILDESHQQNALGCAILRKRIASIQPRFHIFGHMHNNYGIVKFAETTFVNATSFNDSYSLINNPIKLTL